jgi:hypothetical protein
MVTLLEPSWTYPLGEDLNESVRRRDHEVFPGIIPENGHESILDGRIRISDLATNVAVEKHFLLDTDGIYHTYTKKRKLPTDELNHVLGGTRTGDSLSCPNQRAMVDSHAPG